MKSKFFNENLKQTTESLVFTRKMMGVFIAEFNIEVKKIRKKEAKFKSQLLFLKTNYFKAKKHTLLTSNTYPIKFI